jgi:hypothetical protein
LHYQDENGVWQDIVNTGSLQKISGDFDYPPYSKANPQYNGSSYWDMCEDYKVGYQNGWTNRLLPVWDLSITGSGVTDVTSATAKFSTEDTRSNQYITAIGPIYDHPIPFIRVNYQTNYTNVCIGNEIAYISVSTVGQKTYSLPSDERNLIKYRCNGDKWYSLGYKFLNESTSNYLILYPYRLAFTYTGGGQKIAVGNMQPIDVLINPNPFNPVTTINYMLREPSHIVLNIYALNGQKVETLVNCFMNAGSHTVTFDGSLLASGVYLYRFEAKYFSKTGKMLLVK